jgi:hypothetical protein
MHVQHLEAPFAYLKSLPSKGVRDSLADALNLWADLPEEVLTKIKEVVGDFHTASLMFVAPRDLKFMVLANSYSRGTG